MQKSKQNKSRTGWGLFLGLVAGTSAMSFLLFSWAGIKKSDTVAEYMGEDTYDNRDEGKNPGPNRKKHIKKMMEARQLSYAEEPEDMEPAAAPPVFRKRAMEEWQGMLVDLNIRALCDNSSRCGMGMACIEGDCGPCNRDSQCANGESCVLDHCVPEDSVTCHTRDDCENGELCVLTGYSNDTRGNAGMKAKCLADTGGTPQEESPAEDENAIHLQSPVETAFLLDELKASIKPVSMPNRVKEEHEDARE